jgi:lysozyme
MRRINAAGLKLIKDFEGMKLSPYLDSVNIPTIGVGCIQYPDGTKVTMDDPTITEEQALEYLEFELSSKQKAVEAAVTVPINDNQFAALVAFSYNVGSSALQKSTLLKKLLAGDVAGAANEFLKWNKAGGREIAGLTRRRQAERALFLQSAPPGNMLPDGPTEKEIEDKLKDVENDV